MFTSTSEHRDFEEASGEGSAPDSANERLAQGLEAIAAHLGGDPRQGALRRAAALIRACERPLPEAIRESGVEAVHALGINYELAGIVTDWVRSGRLPWLERLEARRREALVALPGIGPRLAKELRDVLGVEDLEGLAEAARDGRLGQVCGFGPKRLKLVMGALLGRPVTKDTRQLSLLAG